MRRVLAGALAVGALAVAPATAGAAPPPGYGYELVSPLAARGFDFTRAWQLPDGDHIALGSEQSDVNGVYLAARTPSGWETRRWSLTPPNGWPEVAAGVAAVADDQQRIVALAVASPSMLRDQLALGEADGSWKIVGSGLEYVGGAGDARRLIVAGTTVAGIDPDDIYPGVPGRETGMFQWRDDGSDDGAVRAIGADAPRLALCGADPVRTADRRSAVFDDGRGAVLASAPGCTDPDDGGAPLRSHLFLWREGHGTVDVTAPPYGADRDAVSVGTSADGRRIFFRTTAAFDPADRNGAADVYRYDVDRHAYVRLTAAATDAGERLLSAAGSLDGSRLWFATRGADAIESLWLVEGDGPPRAIKRAARAVAGEEVFTLEGSSGGTAPQLTPDGATMLLGVRQPIDGVGGRSNGFGSDPGQLFRVTAAGGFDCVTCRAGGAPGELIALGDVLNGQQTLPRSISDDGRTIAFETASPLTDDDRNDLPDVYMWHDGARSLLSAGSEGHSARVVGVDPHGTVGFVTFAELLPWIDDDHQKVYVVRAGGGLPAPVDPRERCEGDGCQGPPAPRAGDPVEATRELTGPGDVDDPAPPFAPVASLRVGRLSAAAERRLARGRRVALRVRSNAAGRVTATVRFKAGRRWLRCGAAARRIGAGRSARLTVRLSKRARARYARRGALRVRIDVVHRRVAKPRRLAFVVKRPAPSRRGAHA